jgi:Autotransporter beta-domain
MNLIKRALAAVVALTLATSALAVDNLPAGAIGTVNNPASNQNIQYTFSFTATQTGSEYIGFAFRQDPAFWNFTNVSLTTGGGSNLLVNGNLGAGGPVAITTNNGPSTIQAPQSWGVWYQNGTYPAAAGSWSGNSWYDGAVGSYDGIYQGFSATAGTTYSISFYALSTYQASSTDQARIGVYAGACTSLTMSASACVPTNTGSNGQGFTPIAVPAQTVNAGTPQANTPVPDPNSAPTVQSTTNGTPIVTTTTTDGSTITTSTSSRGTTTSVAVATLGATAVATAITDSRTTQTAQQLNINRNTTITSTTPVTTVTTSTTPITTVTTNTTPRTVTTVTTPTYIDLYTDNSTQTRNGTPVTTTSTTNIVTTTTAVVNEVVTATTYSNNVDVASTDKSYSTRVDQYSQLSNINQSMNYIMDSGVLDRNRVLADGFNVSKRNNFYVTGSAGQSNTQNGYSYTSATYGLGYDWQFAPEWIVGGQYNRGQANLNGATGTNAGGSLNKDAIVLYSAYTLNDWILKNDFGYAMNTFNTNHSLPELGMSNTSSTNGQDMWATARVYTPEFLDLRPFVGVRTETNQRNGVTESGTPLTAMTYSAVNNNKTSTDVGVRYDTIISTDWRITGEYAYNSQNFNTAYASVGYAIDPKSVIRLRYGYGKQYDYTVQSAMIEARFNF